MVDATNATAEAASFDFQGHTFREPAKTLVTVEHVEEFKNSDGCKELIGFITALQTACRTTAMTTTPLTENLTPLYNFLEDISVWIDEVPPIEQPMRFGNRAYRTLMDRVIAASDERLAQISSLPGFEKAIPEIKIYWEESFGSYERIDYGTGHELNFIAFLFCMFKLGAYNQADLCAAINKVFQKYMVVMRKIQLTYMLEPAGSHGVWGLDDYQHLAFLFGASQLVRSQQYIPESIHDESALREEDNYMYFGCIRFIKKVKKGVRFGESSPMLNDISAVPSWDKVSTGLLKMFNVEVIGKHPVIKHLKFGSILVFRSQPTP